MKKTILIVLAILLAGGAYIGFFYNGLVKKDQAVKSQWAQVENQFQRRFELIPNLVNSVKGAMSQEQKIFSEITEARTRYAGALSGSSEKVQAANDVEAGLGRLLVVMENYPQLKSIDTVQTLMVQLEGTENRVAVERGRYNESVRDFNNKVITFPGNIIAGMFGFSAKTYFESAQGAQTAPQVQL